MDNIILAGLCFDENLGDQAIAYTTTMYVNDYIQEKDCKIDIRLIDLQGRKESQKEIIVTSNDKASYLKKWIYNIKNIFPVLVHKIAEKRILYLVHDLCMRNIDSDTRAIIFVGGGLIKYKQQFLVKPIAEIVSLAEKNSIPVMFSGVGVEGYDFKNVDCRRIKDFLNSEATKYVTTRDDYECLVNNYIKNKKIVIAKVADSACGINRYIKKTHSQIKCIGLGVANPDLFKKYGLDYSREQYMNLFVEIVSLIKEKGYEIKIFTNGASDDFEFARKVVERIGNKSILEERPRTINELISRISSYDGIIATRMHSAILAYSYSVPAVSLTWNHKQRLFYNSINRDKYCIEIPDFSARFIVDLLETFISEGYNEKKRKEYVESTNIYISQFLDTYL